VIDQLHLATRSSPEAHNLGLIERKINQLIAQINMDTRLFGSEQLINLLARTTSFNTDFEPNQYAIGAIFSLRITGASGTTPTLDIKFQRKAPDTTFTDIPGAAFAQKTTTGSDQLVIYPGVDPVANKAVGQVLGQEMRVVCTIGGTTPSFDIILNIEPLG
jgi:hypothetical protein